MRFEMRGERTAWAEILVFAGGVLLIVAYGLPLLHMRHHGGPVTQSAASLIVQNIGDVLGGSGFRQRVLSGLAVCFFLAPHALGLVAAADAAGSRLSFRGLERVWRFGLRAVLYPWIAGSILLPVMLGRQMEPEVRTISFLFAGVLLVGWFVLGRWWPPVSHAAFMRRGRLLGSILAGVWVGYYLGSEVGGFPPTIITSLAGTALIAVGSISGLRERPEPPWSPPPATG